MRIGGQLPEQFAFARAWRRGHGDLHDGKQIAGAFAFGQAAMRQPQMLAGFGARGHFEAHGAIECRHSDAGAEHRFPRRQRQIDIKIVPAGAEQRVRRQRDVEIEVAMAPAIETRAALARNAQALACGHALWHLHAQGVRHAVRHTVLVMLDGDEIEFDFGAARCLFECDARIDFVVLARHRKAAAGAPPRQAGEQIGEIGFIESSVRIAMAAVREACAEADFVHGLDRARLADALDGTVVRASVAASLMLSNDQMSSITS